MTVVAVGTGVKNGEEDARLGDVKRTLMAWWASRAPEDAVNRYIAGRSDGGISCRT